MRCNRRLIAALAMGVAGAASAADDRPYAALLAQYTMHAEEHRTQSVVSGYFALGIPLGRDLALEFDYVEREADLTGGGGSRSYAGFGASALWFLERDGSFDPYVVIGYTRFDNEVAGVDLDFESSQLGLGFVTDLSDDLALRGEVRGYRSGRQTFVDVALGLGFVYRFGVQGLAAPAPVDRDSDRDGVMDRTDRCPETLRGTSVDAAGCALPVDGNADRDGVRNSADRCPGTPAAVRVDATGCELDGDGDGVRDGADRCPATSEGVSVDALGCALDGDGDGVTDGADRCPDTPAGIRVLTDGCPVPLVLELEGVNFETASDSLTPGSRAKLDEAVAKLKDNPTVTVEVAGHTDGMGDATRNRLLSQRRAESVRTYLLRGGVAADQVTARGYGADEPLTTNDTAAGRAQNRRVELRVQP